MPVAYTQSIRLRADGTIKVVDWPRECAVYHENEGDTETGWRTREYTHEDIWVPEIESILTVFVEKV